MTYMEQTEEEKLQDRKKYRNKSDKTYSHEVGKSGNGNRFHIGSHRLAPSSSSVCTLRDRNDPKS